MSDEFAWRASKEFKSGEICRVENYLGTCNNCGGEIRFDSMFAMYIGRYVDEAGNIYDRWVPCFYLMCHSCRFFMDGINWYMPIVAPALFRKEEKDEKPG